MLQRTLYKELANSGFTMLEERIKHLDEVFDKMSSVEGFFIRFQNKLDALEIVQFLIDTFPGYASDLFLKRAMLMPMMLFRETGVEMNNMDKLLVPIDYQIPKVLIHLGILEIDDLLMDKISRSEQLPKSSLEEVSLRSAALLATNKISEIHNIPKYVLDDIMFAYSKEIKDTPHHLTLTTDY
jgi:hypothetical protein